MWRNHGLKVVSQASEIGMTCFALSFRAKLSGVDLRRILVPIFVAIVVDEDRNKDRDDDGR